MRRTAFLKSLQTVDKLLCKDKMGFWGEAPSKVAGAAAPDNKPLPEGKGLGVRDREIAVLIKKIDFFDKLERLFKAVEFRFRA